MSDLTEIQLTRCPAGNPPFGMCYLIPPTTFREFVAYAKANAGRLNVMESHYFSG
jgi:hypothetical protein